MEDVASISLETEQDLGHVIFFQDLVWLQDHARLPLTPLEANPEGQNSKSRRTYREILTNDCSQK